MAPATSFSSVHMGFIHVLKAGCQHLYLNLNFHGFIICPLFFRLLTEVFFKAPLPPKCILSILEMCFVLFLFLKTVLFLNCPFGFLLMKKCLAAGDRVNSWNVGIENGAFVKESYYHTLLKKILSSFFLSLRWLFEGSFPCPGTWILVSVLLNSYCVSNIKWQTILLKK